MGVVTHATWACPRGVDHVLGLWSSPRGRGGSQASGLAFQLLSDVSSPGAEHVQHLEPRSLRIPLLCAPGLGAPDHPVLCREEPQGGESV